jgi:hypothetical protein
MTDSGFFFEGNTDLRRRAEQLSGREDSPEIRQEWLLIAEEASLAGDWLLSEYAYSKGLGLRVLW